MGSALTARYSSYSYRAGYARPGWSVSVGYAERPYYGGYRRWYPY